MKSVIHDNMYRRFTSLFLACLGAVSMSGCFMTPETYDTAVPSLLVRGILKAGVPVDSVVIRRTISPDLYWDNRDDDLVRVSGAFVTITHAGKIDTLTETIIDSLIQGGQKGVYSNLNIIPVSGETYRLDVYATLEGNDLHAFAETTLPWPLSLTSGGYDTTIVYPGQYNVNFDDVPMRLTWEHPNFKPAGHVLGIVADTSNATGRWLKDFDEKNYGELLTDHVNSDGTLTDSENWPWARINYERHDYRDGRRLFIIPLLGDSTAMDLFWFMFRFEGSYDVVISALGFDLWEFYRTAPGGGSGNDSDVGAIQNVKGDGLGIFGSWYTVRFPIRIARQ